MSRYDRMTSRWTRLKNRYYARKSRKIPAATGFVSQPEPRTIGSMARGRQLIAGNLLFAGYLIESKTTALWDVEAPDLAFEAERQGCTWLDDLAAIGDTVARKKAQHWVWGWIDTYSDGRGSGPIWSPDVTGRRLIRWINHALFLLGGTDKAQSDPFYKSLSQQTWFLSQSWRGATPGLPRFEALTGLIYAGLALKGCESMADPAVQALAEECNQQIDDQGGLPTRNPEELLDVFTLLIWAAAALKEAGRSVSPEHHAAIERIAPTLRALRHSDGSLARFHGGGRGQDGWLDHALAASHVPAHLPDGAAMGFVRMALRRTSVIFDAAPPPLGAASVNGHASTLGFELTSGRRPLVVNCGSGEQFGQEWRRAGRATPSHSVLCLERQSSAHLAQAQKNTGYEFLTNPPEDVRLESQETVDTLAYQGAHDSYSRKYGLTYARALGLASDGRSLTGEDMLLALDPAAKARFDRALDDNALQGLSYDLRFHLHPDVDAALDLGGAAVSMALKSGEIWIFRHDGQLDLKLEPSVYLERNRLKPRSSLQIVLSGRAIQHATQVRWTFAKAKDTAVAVRDVNRDAPDVYDND